MTSSSSAKTLDHSDSDLAVALRGCRDGFVGIGVFSGMANVLMLTGPIFMLQVYDRVLTSRSHETLLALLFLVAGLYIFLAIFDFIRSRVAARLGTYLDRLVNRRLFSIWTQQAVMKRHGVMIQPLQDFQQLRQFLSGNGVIALFDLPWVPVYLALIFFLHWTLGLVALAGAILAVGLAVLNDRATSKYLDQANGVNVRSNNVALAAQRNSEVLGAMGMERGLYRTWRKGQELASNLHLTANDRGAGFASGTKSLRMFLQSLMLGVGALLAIEQIVTPGVMIAASIIMGRALAPIDQTVGNWKGITTARQAYKRLRDLFDVLGSEESRTDLPEPQGAISAIDVRLSHPEASRPILDGLRFSVSPGQAVGVIGPSASGKSSLARLLVGVWRPSSGEVRLDGATFDQLDRERIGRWIGYLPQDVELFSGTVKENIARFQREIDDASVVDAAQVAGVHEMILKLPEGYETQIGDDGAVLSGGQRQRIGLARAYFGNPKLIVLDEPNASLDHEGDIALKRAIESAKRNGQTVFVMAHRPSAIAAVDLILMIKDGRQVAFGPKDEVLKNVTENQRAMAHSR